MSRLVSVIFFILCFLACHPVVGQVAGPPYAEWISKLSVKNDPLSSSYNSVQNEIIKIDSQQLCEVFTNLISKGPANNLHYQIRLRLLQQSIQFRLQNVRDCPLKRPAVDLLNEALNMAYELEDDQLTYHVYQGFVGYYATLSNYGKGVLYGLLAKELFDQIGKDKAYPMSYVLYSLAHCLYHSREYRASIDILLKILGPERNTYLRSDDTIVNFYRMFSWNTLGLAYAKLEKPDSAFIAFDTALAIAQSEHKPFWVSLVTGNKGDVYFQEGKYDSAEPLLKFDYEGSLKAKEYDNAGNTLQWLARIDLINNKPDEALKKTREAQRLISTSYNPDYMARTLFTYTKVFAQLGKADSVSYYLEKFLTLHDSIEQEASDARAEMIQQRLESQDNIHKIQTLHKEKDRIKLVRNFIVAFILMLALIGFMILNRQKLKLIVRRQEAIEAKRIAEQDALSAKEQLNNFTRTLIEKTTLVETLQAQLIEKELSEEQSQHIAELTGHAILTDEDWDNFKSMFEKVYPNFFQSLKRNTEGITIAEQRMASLIKLKVPAKKAAIILGISPNSVYKTRQRLRHRLGLSTDGELDDYFS